MFFNFSINYDSRNFGEVFNNGTKTGVLKLIDEREIDGSAHNYMYTELRAEHFDFIFPTMQQE
jgi:hypothetical protein